MMKIYKSFLSLIADLNTFKHTRGLKDWMPELRDCDGNRRFFVDISNLAMTGGGHSGMNRVTRHLLLEWIKVPQAGYAIQPICDDGSGYKLVSMENIEERLVSRERLPLLGYVTASEGDIYLGLDWMPFHMAKRKKVYRFWKNSGVRLFWILHDIIPIRHPEYYNLATDVIFSRWLDGVLELAEGIVTISRYVADDLASYYHERRSRRGEKLKIAYSYNACDMKTLCAADVLPDREKNVFLMVGIVTLRKGYTQVLDAFERLWREGVDVKLLIIGTPGFKANKLIRRLESHAEHGQKLTWLKNADDERLKDAYSRSSAMIYSSFAEGFGIPLIEAASFGLPVISRDLPLFREVAGECAFYFEGNRPEDLSEAIKKWLELNERDEAPGSQGMPAKITWHESAEKWKRVIFGDSGWYRILDGNY
jgi:glycosyltransferase involved in cell wall biosynthesis